MQFKNQLTLIILLVSNSLIARNPSNPDTVLTIRFPKLPPTMYQVAMDKDDLPMATVFLPAEYNVDKKYPVLLWINGGMGGPGDGARSLADTYGDTGFIYINIPQFKLDIAPVLPDSSNYWSRLMLHYEPDNPIIWDSYKVMLDSIWSLVPNIDNNNSFMGGFSNGAHTTAILLNRPNAEILGYFNKFVFVEGGRGLSNYKVLKDKLTLFMQGEKGPDWIRPIYQNAKDEGSLASFILMEGFGHEFPSHYKEVFKKWLLEHVDGKNGF